MTFNTAKYIPLEDKVGPVFLWGIIDNNPQSVIPYANTPYARNFRVFWYGIGPRPGYQQIGSDLGTNVKPNGMGLYLRATAATSRVVVWIPYDATHGLVTVTTDGVWTQAQIATAGNIASTNRMNFVCTNDVVYCMNWSDPFGKLSGTTYTTPATWVANFSPAFWVWFNNSLWCSGDPKFPNRLYKSSTASPEDFTGTGSDTKDDTFPVVGLGANAQTLYVFTEQSIDMFNVNSIKTFGTSIVYTSVPLEASEGASNHNSIVSVGNYIYYLTKGNKIKRIAQWQGQIYDVQELSHRLNQGINNTMALLDPDQSNSFAYAVPDKQIIKWHCKTLGATWNDICIVYHWQYDQFMVDTQKPFIAWVWNRGKAYTVSQLEPKLYQDEYSHDDDWSPIPFEYRTKLLDFWEPTILKELWQLRTYCELNTAAVITQSTYADGGQVDVATIDVWDIPQAISGIGTQAVATFAIGEDWYPNDLLYDAWVVREKGDLQVRAKNFQIIYTSSTIGGNFLLKNVSPRIQGLDQLTTSTTR